MKGAREPAKGLELGQREPAPNLTLARCGRRSNSWGYFWLRQKAAALARARRPPSESAAAATPSQRSPALAAGQEAGEASSQRGVVLPSASEMPDRFFTAPRK